MIRRSQLDLTLEYVRRTGVHTDIEKVLHAKPGGRPRVLPVDVLLAAMLLTATHSKNLKLTSVHKTLTEELARNVRRDLKVEHLTIRQVRYLFSAISAAYEHTPGRRPGMDAGDRIGRKDALQDILDKLTGSASVFLPSKGRYAIDETAIDTPARMRGGTAQVNGPSRRKRRPGKAPKAVLAGAAGGSSGALGRGARRPHDPDARLGYRTRTYANRSSYVYGYQLVAFTRIGPDSPTCREAEPPALVDRIALVAGDDKGLPETIGLLDRLHAAGSPACDIVVDRGFSDAAMADFRGPLAERGVEVTLDLKKTDHGSKPHKDGYLVIDGDPYCPAIPTALRTIHPDEDIKAKKPGPRGAATEQADFQARMRKRARFSQLIEQRAQYRLESKGPAKKGKSIRFTCPAKVGKLACDGCPLSQHLPQVTHVTAPQVRQADGAVGHPKVCDSSVTVPLEVLGKHHQKYRWGSKEWRRSYDRRIRVEQSFGFLKGPTDGILRSGWTLQVGHVKTSLLLGVVIAAHNLTTLLRWARTTGWDADPLTRIVIPHRGDLDDPDNGTGASAPAQPGAPPTVA